jgi:pyrroloquinoline-quinone synthase
MSDKKKTASRAPRVAACAEKALKRVRIMDNPYFRALESGTMSLAEFRRSQQQFFFAVTFFPRPMAALLARIPDPAARLDILHNLVEEHGEFRKKAFHHNTFQNFLRSIHGRIPRKEPLWPEVRAFNAVLTAACVLDEYEVGVACMGVIERAFASISALIGRAVVERGWVAQPRLVHYKLHAEIDARHAEEFFAVVERSWSDPRRRYLIVQGLDMGAYAFDRFYRDLYLHACGEPK